MPFDPTAPVLALIIEPGDEVATLKPVEANVPEAIAKIVDGNVEAIEIDGRAVMWLNEAGKNLGRRTNLLATKIAHRLHAGLYPDDTINGTAILVGESAGPTGDLVCCDIPVVTMNALRELGVMVEGG